MPSQPTAAAATRATTAATATTSAAATASAATAGLALLAVLATGACASGGTGTPGPTTATQPTTSASADTGSPQDPPPPPQDEPAAPGLEYRVSYDWGVPGTEVTVEHPRSAPLPGPIGLPYLVGVYVGDHPEDATPYQRISFYFRGDFPSYRLQYVAVVYTDGQGAPVALPGNAALRVVFAGAQAHDENGDSTVAASPPAAIGFANLRGYAFAGDYEGYVTYGLGIQVASGSDQTLPIRAGELRKPDGAGDFFYVVHVDVQAA